MFARTTLVSWPTKPLLFMGVYSRPSPPSPPSPKGSDPIKTTQLVTNPKLALLPITVVSGTNEHSISAAYALSNVCPSSFVVHKGATDVFFFQSDELSWTLLSPSSVALFKLFYPLSFFVLQLATMLFRAPTVLVTAWFAVSVMAAACRSGEYKNTQGQCKTCADGTISPSNPPSSGSYNCNPCPAGQTSNSGHSQCQNCTPGTYNSVQGGTCDTCPDGSVNNVNGAQSCNTCPAGQSSNPAHTQCTKCSPGNYNDTPGGTCRPCASGYFTSISGAKSCCQCCAGFYANSANTGSTNCNQCPASKKYSFAGSNDNSDCVSSNNRRGQPDPVDSCNINADNQCPNPTGSGPVGSPVARKKRDMHCTRGLQACPRYAGRGGFECINTRSDPESCGGCRDLDGKGSGSDCTAITGVSVTRCVKGSCVIDSCQKGYTKSLDGSSCVSSSSADGSNTEAFNAQEMGARMKRNSFAKRFARTL